MPNHPEQNLTSSSKSDHISSDVSGFEEEDREILHSWDTAILNEVFMLQITKCTLNEEREIAVFYARLLRLVMGQEKQFRRIGIAEIDDVDGLGEYGWESKDCLIV